MWVPCCKAFPDAAGTFCDIGFRATETMHPEVLVGTVAEQLRTARAEVGESGDVLLGSQGSRLMEVDLFLGHCRSPLLNTLAGE